MSPGERVLILARLEVRPRRIWSAVARGRVWIVVLFDRFGVRLRVRVARGSLAGDQLAALLRGGSNLAAHSSAL
jgi:hypothetical protein